MVESACELDADDENDDALGDSVANATAVTLESED